MYSQICPKKVPLEFKVSGIYSISFGEHTYIGSSKNVQQRISQHRKKLRAHNHQANFQKYYDSFGEENMMIRLLEVCEENQTRVREKYWIESLDPDINCDKVNSTNPIKIVFNGSGSKKVYQYTMEGIFIQEFPSVKEASRYLKVDSRGIGLCASDNYNHYKSAYGFRWSYAKMNKLPKYINNSSKAVIKKVILFNCLTGEEFIFESIAEAVRQISPNATNFDSECASLSCSSNRCCYYKNYYLAKSTLDAPYIIPKRNAVIYNKCTNTVYKNAKEASLKCNQLIYHIKKACNKEHAEWVYMNQRARVKLRESGKLFE